MNFKCFDISCEFSKKTIYSERSFVFYHYYSKPRSKLIELVILHSLISNPYQERTNTLANKLTDSSEVTY